MERSRCTFGVGAQRKKIYHKPTLTNTNKKELSEYKFVVFVWFVVYILRR